MEAKSRKPFTSMMNKPIIGFFMGAGIVAGGIYSYMADPVYTSTVKLRVPVSSVPNGSISLFGSKKSINTEELKTDQFLTNALLNSDGLVTKFSETDFRKEAAHYSFPYEISYNVIGNKAFQTQQYIITPVDDNQYLLQSTYYDMSRMKQGKYGVELIDNNLALTINKKPSHVRQPVGLITNTKYSFEIASPASKASELLLSDNTLSVDETNGVLTINVETNNPYNATAFANAVAENFIKEKNSGTAEIAEDDTELMALSDRLMQTEKEIAHYKKINQLTEINTDTEVNLNALKELEQQKLSLELQLAALDNLTNYLRKNREINNSQVEYGVIVDPSFAEHISKLNEKYEAKNSGTAASATDAEIENLKLLIAERILNTRKKTAVQIDKINEAIAISQKAVSRIPEQASTLLALERKMQLDKKVYDMMIEKKAAAIVGSTSNTVAAKIIAPANLPTSPVWPVAYLMLAIGSLVGLLSGVLVSYMVTSLRSRKIRTRTELSDVLKMPFIATVGEKTMNINNTDSMISNLCTSILMKPQVKVLTFASANTGEGKTFIATELAQELAGVDKKVLLMDMNLTNPEIAAHYKITPDQTLTEVLAGSCDVHDAICLTAYPNLEVLSPGNLNAGVNTFLSSSRKESVMTELKKHYDYIIIDTAGTNECVDAIAMMKISDLNLYVVKANSTRKSSLVNAERIQTDYNISEMHLLLNNSSSKTKTQTANKNRNRNRPVNVQRNTPAGKSTFVPAVLKRIALWFY